MKRAIELKSPREIAKIREAGRVVAKCHEVVRKMAAPGVTTLEINNAIESLIRAEGGMPSFLGYKGFPASVCASVNDEVVHGIPNTKPLKAGDVLSIDVGVYKGGFHGDAALTLAIGEVSVEAKRLIETTRESLYAGIEQIRPGNRLSDIVKAVEAVGRREKFGIVQDYGGHGIGRNLHEDPHVPNWMGPGFLDLELKVGLVLAIEPMFNLGTHEVRTLSDGWTVVTVDGKCAAHWEHDVAVTASGPEILSLP